MLIDWKFVFWFQEMQILGTLNGYSIVHIAGARESALLLWTDGKAT